MFGRRSAASDLPRTPPAVRVEPTPAKAAAPSQPAPDTAPQPLPGRANAAAPPPPPKPVSRIVEARSDDYYQIKTTIFNALIDTIDLAQLAQLDADSAREEIRDIVNEIISIKAVVMSIAEQEHL